MELLILKERRTGKEFEFVRIEDEHDVEDYIQWLREETTNTITRAIKSGKTPDTWDHFFNDGRHSVVVSLATGIAKISGTNPIYEIDSALSNISATYYSSFAEHGYLMINKRGGCGAFEFGEGKDCELVSRKEFNIFGKDHLYHIAETPTFLNLENDPELESHTIRWSVKNNVDLSYVLRLSSFSDVELSNVFKEFVERGGSALYVYTTGSDLNQLFNYCRLAKKAGINDVVFDFSAHVSKELKNTVDEVKEFMKVTVL